LSIAVIINILIFFGVLCYFSSQPKTRNESKNRLTSNQDHTPTTHSEESYQVLFRGLRKNSALTRFFFPLYMLRIGFPTIIAVAAESIPILNVVMQLAFSAGVVSFIVLLKPFTKKINYYQIIISETIVLIMNFFMVIITMLCLNDKENYKFAIFLADLVILGNDIINILLIVFLIVKLHSEIKQIREYTKKKNSSRKSNYRTLGPIIICTSTASQYGIRRNGCLS